MQKQQTAGGRRGREAGPAAAAALGGARKNSTNRRWLAMLSYERARGLRVFASRFSVSSDSYRPEDVSVCIFEG